MNIQDYNMLFVDADSISDDFTSVLSYGNEPVLVMFHSFCKTRNHQLNNRVVTFIFAPKVHARTPV